MWRIRWRIGACLSLFLIAACAPGRDLPPLSEAMAGPYRLGPGDQVRIITVGDESLTGEFRVDDAGRIAVPMLGSLRAGGLTSEALGDEGGLIRAPSVSVEVIHYRPIFVLGEVNKPGEFSYQPGMTLLTAVALAGGFTYRAVEDYASVVRNANGRATEARAGRASPLQPGDVVTVFERRF
jgi:polysaccharide export outer membrane protein